MRTGHLFAGAGGGLLADLILGHEPVFAVEWDAYACAVLRERSGDGWYPELRVHECDVREFDARDYAGRVDCLHAGFPCTDLSVAGLRAGIREGTRSGLWSEVVRVAGDLRPRFLFLENVADIVSMRPGLDVVLADLAALGFDARWLCVRATDAGADITRERWFCLAAKSDVLVGQAWAWGESDGARPVRPVGHRVDALDHPASWLEVAGEFAGSDDALANRLHRTECLGNGQVPLQAALAWHLLGGPTMTAHEAALRRAAA